MTRWLPRTLFGQMLLILLAGLLASNLVGTLIYASERAQAVRAISGYAAAQRIANVAQLLDDAPPEWRDRIVAAASDPTLRVTLSPEPPAFEEPSDETDSATIRDYLAEQLPDDLLARLQVSVVIAPFSGFAHHRTSGGRAMMTSGGQAMMTPDGQATMTPGGPATMGGRFPADGSAPAGLPDGVMQRVEPHGRHGGGLESLRAAMQLPDGEWLGFAAALPNAPSAVWPFAAAMAMMAVIVVLASVWAVRRVTAPLHVLARAAERLGRDVNAPPIGEAGTQETRQAAQSFNQMQARIRRLLDNRTHMLAALSHDLRTPLTLLRLRTEALPEREERDRMLATIGELDAMIGASLDFVRDQATVETARRTDLTALLASVVDDMADAGLPVTLVPAEPDAGVPVTPAPAEPDAGMPVTLAPAVQVVLECQPGALRRALTNLIDNAVKYGGAARVAIESHAAAVAITIDDDGPGIPEAEQRRVFEPFHRLEPSRSRETGGTGLGLSIALSIVQAHGGDISLTNRPMGGLRASVSLPRQPGTQTQ
jgi:signal transduction histidine kinase